MEINIENREQIIKLLQAGICPICGKGNFKNPLQHTRQAHFLNSQEFKDILLLNRDTGFASLDLSEKHRQNALKNDSVHTMLNNRPKIDVNPTDLTKTKFSNTIKTKLDTDFKYKEYMLKKAKKAQQKAHIVRQIPVVRIADNEQENIYESITDAAKANGVTIGAIRYALQHNTKSAGYRWKYKE